MYTSLDRIDTAVQNADGSFAVFVQTDARSTEEIEQEAPFSVLFAITRLFSPRQMVGEGAPLPEMRYMVFCEPPELLCEAVASVGGVMVRYPDIRIPFSGEARSADDLVDEAMQRLSREVLGEQAPSRDVLVKLEEALVDSPPDREEEEGAYFRAVVRLGAVAGEVLRSATGGSWQVLNGAGTLAFAFAIPREDGKSWIINPCGKVIKLLANGSEDSVVGLVDYVMREAQEQAGN